ncbi:MAG: DEAD/DEAH box helicase [Eubacteriales bacterium]|nr:DEAD/DEAH box helicase [Eubacteriales bacterium]
MENTLNFFFSPNGILCEISDTAASESDVLWKKRFDADMAAAIYAYGLDSTPDSSAVGTYMRKMVGTFLKKLTDLPELETAREKAKIELTDSDIDSLLHAVPFAIGSEYVTKAWLKKLFKGLNRTFSREIADYNGSVALYFEEKHQNLHVPERIFFHLVENRQSSEFPFAFLATYASIDKNGKVRHYPLRYALTEYEHERHKLLELLSCLNRAADVSPLISDFMENGELFHPLQLTGEEAWQFLRSVPAIEGAGILCRIPNWWRKNAATPTLTMRLGDKKPSAVGAQALLSVTPQLMLDGVELSKEDIRELLAKTEGLAMLKGKWVQVDHNRLKALLDSMEKGGSISLIDALRRQTGISEDKDSVQVTNGQWLSELLYKLREPKTISTVPLPKDFCATLRPYQKNGYKWLNYMGELGFGACLADDMGLGKTVQVLAYLDRLRNEEPDARCLLVVPASLLGNWQKEAAKFAPEMLLEIFHDGTAKIISADLESRSAETLPFLSVTTYGMAARIEAFRKLHFRCLILDEAQAIKNSGTKQTRAVKDISADMRIAMTGTPIENDLTNLWSLFDFLNSGLMGTAAEFADFAKKLQEHPENYEKLRMMISPFMLRRLKTDKSIIRDLPEKIEVMDYAPLSKTQTVLYRKVLVDLEEALATVDGMQRRGIVLASIMKLKQICNHPSQYLGLPEYAEEDSGKFALLREICETVRDKRERVLVFTQFREVIPALQDFLAGVFGRKGYVLHGGTSVKERGEIVDAFQSESYVPYLILSVKAGGTGLNLTKASHVIHFDRWWNPAVENQATDRSYRIGQKNNVIVHKMVCRSTIEERIDEIISSKKELAENVIGSGGESWITELSNEQLMNLLRLG